MSETAKTSAIASAPEFSVARETATEQLAGHTVRVRPCDRCDGRGTRLDAYDAGSLIREERRALHLRTADFAARVGLSTAYVVDLEMGRRPWARDLFCRAVTVLGRARAEQAAAGLVHCCSAPCFAGEPSVGECSCACHGCTAERDR